LSFWRRRREEDLDEEIASHLAMATRDRVADGEDPREAHFAARKEFGNVTLTREATRLSWRGRWIERLLDLLRDVSYGMRLLRRSPGYAAVVVAVLAVGIAANVIAFSFFKAVALTPLAGVARSGSLLYVAARSSGGGLAPLSYPDYKDVRDRAFPDLGAWGIQPLILGHGNSGQPIVAEFVTGNYFDVLGVRAQLGRLVSASDTQTAHQQPVVVLSDGLWRRAFGGTPAIVGTTVRINSNPLTVVGVTAPTFHGGVVGVSTDLFLPLTMVDALTGFDWLNQRNERWLSPFMHPPAGMSREVLAARAAAVSREIAAEDPTGLPDRAVLVPIWQWPFGAQTLMLPAVGLIGAMAVLLLIVVAANVAGLVLVRSLARRGETAARLTLGASRGRVLRQLLIESLVLAIPGAVLGFLLPRFLEPYLAAATTNVSYPLYFNAEPDRSLVGFTVLLTVICAIAYGLGPALRLSRVELSTVLKDDLAPRGASRHRLRTVLVVAQVAVAVVLLVGTALILRTLEAAQRANAGFDQHVTWTSFDARAAGHDEAGGREWYRGLLDAVRAESGVEAAGLATFLPLTMIDFMTWGQQPEGYQPREGEDLVFAVNVVSSDYFRTMGIPIVAGREFDSRDDDDEVSPAVVNETFARRFWGSPEAAIGRRLTEGKGMIVVGVARDIKYARLDEQPRPYLYASFSHMYLPSMTLHVRGTARTAQVVDRIRAHARRLDPQMTMLDSGVLGDQVRGATSLYETVARVLTIIGALASILAALGVYGLVAYTVRQSAHEIGVRAAVGATQGMLLRRFLARGLALSATGVIIGIAASLALSRLMANLLYGVAATDSLSFAAAAMLLLAAAAVASFVPAWRGARVDPVVALRHQ
jgi:predicted permease